MKTNITKAFLNIDKTLNDLEFLSKKLNNGESFISKRIDYNPENLKYKSNDKNNQIWECIEKDHNGYYKVFLFRTCLKYPDNITSDEKRKNILENSELRKPFLIEDNIEFGITIEDSLIDPNDIVWGYTFKSFKYYIIKNDVLTITNNRSKIRKIYNNKQITETNKMIRYEDEFSYHTKEIDNFYKLYDNLYTCEIDGIEYYIGNEKSLDEYALHLLRSEEYRSYLIGILGGIDNIVNNYLDENKLNLNTYLMYNSKEVFDLLNIDYEFHQVRYMNMISDNFTYDTDINLNKLGLFKKNDT